MKARFYALLFLIGSSLVMNSCQEEETNEAVVVRTLGAEIGEDGGVVLKAKLTGFNKIQDHAIWITYDPASGYWEEYPLGRPTASGSFQQEITSGLVQGTYYYKAAIFYQGQWVFGDTKTFRYDKNKLPVIESVSPIMAHIGDTLTITGKNFGRSTYQNVVLFGEATATTVSGSETQVRVIVPPYITATTSTLQLSVMGISVPYKELFRLHKPVITALEPATAPLRGIVEIKGDHFDLGAGNLVRFGDVDALIASATRTSIKVIVPDNLVNGAETISVFAQIQKAVSPVPFNLQAPELTGISMDKGMTLDQVQLTGTNFHPIAYQNKVYFGDALAEVIAASSTSLTVRVPNGPYPKRTCSVKVDVLGSVSVNQNVLFTIEDPWLVVSNTLPFSYNRGVGTFVLNDVAYVIAPSKDYRDENAYLWKFNPEDLSWDKQLIPIDFKWSGICVTNGDKAYLYSATASNNFWEFNALTNQWSKKADFPGERRDKPASFAINDDIYIGIGEDFEPYMGIPYINFFKYDPASDSWSEISEVTGMNIYEGRTEASTFTLNGKAYIGGGARTTGMYDFWQYDPAGDTWTRKADIGPYSYTASFVMNGKGYLAAGYECWEYTDATNTWKNRGGIGNVSRSGPFAFTLKNVPYVGGGSASWDGSRDYELLQLDPARME